MKTLAIRLMLMLTVLVVSPFASSDQNFVLCVSKQFSKGFALEYNSHDSGCVVDDLTSHNFSESNSILFEGLDGTIGISVDNPEINKTHVSDGLDSPPPGSGPVIGGGVFAEPFTVVFESDHKVLGIVAKGNCNIRSERSERVAINVLKDGKKVSSFVCYHPDNLSNTYCQQTVDSESIGLAFTEASSRSACTSDEDVSGSVGVLIYPTND